MYWLILLLIICLLIYKFFQTKYSYWKELNVPHVKPSIPFGNFKDVARLIKSPGQFIHEIYNKTKEKVIGTWILWIPYLIIRDPSLINSVLVQDFNNFSNHAVLSEEKCDSLCSKMMFFLSNPQWKNVRANLSPNFSLHKLKAMTPLIKEAAEDMSNYLFDCGGQPLETKEFATKFSTDMVMSCMFGLKGNSFTKDNIFYLFSELSSKFTLMNKIRFLVYFFLPDIGRLLKISFVNPKITNFLREIVLQTFQEREISNSHRNDIVDNLIKLRKLNIDVYGDGKSFDGDRLVATSAQMFMAGIRTTGSLLAHALFEIGRHKDIQAKLRQEMTRLNVSEDFSFEALNEMVYLDQVVCETLRKYPVLEYLDRRATEDYQLPNTDYVIKKGVAIYIPLLGLHYDPKYFPDPYVFDPERFSKENIAKRKENVYLPFGNGPRFCIGNKFGLLGVKVGIVQVLREFRIVKCEKTVPLVFDRRVSLTGGLWMKYEALRN